MVSNPLEKISDIIIIEVPILSLSNFKVEKDQNYKDYLKLLLREGNDRDFF